MKISELKGLLSDKRVMEEIHKHLWIESQKAGYNIGIERATDEWLKLYSQGWIKFHLSEKKSKKTKKAKNTTSVKKAKKKIVKTKAKTVKKKTAKPKVTVKPKAKPKTKKRK